jgi:hypothetical protein
LRRQAFAAIQGGADLATAKIDAVTKLTGGSYGLVLVDGQLMVGKGTHLCLFNFLKAKLIGSLPVLTMYEKGGGKGGKHGWVSTATSIGTVSYIPVQIWQQFPRQCQFRVVWHAPTLHLGLPMFNHLPCLRFLLYIPPQSVRVLSSGMLELTQAFYEKVYMDYLAQQAAIVVAVDWLIKKSRKKKGKETDNNA